MIIRLTNKMFKKIKESPSEAQPEAENPFIDWVADPFFVNRHNYIIITNCASVLSWIFPGKGINDVSTFIKCSMTSVFECLDLYGFDAQFQQIILPSFGNVKLRKVADKNMSGILVDLVKTSKFFIGNYGLSLRETSIRINEIPQLTRKEPFPAKAFQLLPDPKR